MIKAKICGITTGDDAAAAVEEGADYLGLVFAPSPRQVDESKARQIMNSIPGFKNWVAVFVDKDRFDVLNLARTLNISHLQLHGSETPEECAFFSREGFEIIKAHRIQNAGSFEAVTAYETPCVLFDSYSRHREGGTGEPFDWNLLAGRSFNPRVFLSGGLKSATLPLALAAYLPYAVDVSSGVEDSPGRKSRGKIKEFIQTLRSFENQKKRHRTHG